MQILDSERDSTTEVIPPRVQITSEVRQVKVIRIAFWVIGVLCGIGQMWSARHQVISDGISYLEIAQAYLRHDWANALNAYWSPLFSWLIALFIFILHPTPYWEVAVAHLVLLAAFVASFASFDYFLHQLSAIIYTEKNAHDFPVSKVTLYLAGYSGLLFGGLALIGVGYCSPDMIAFALTFLIAGILLRISRDRASDFSYVVLGAACGLFYLDRTAFAPSIAIVLLVLGVLLYRQQLSLVRPFGLFAATIILLGAPFAAAITLKAHHLTIGESGRLNYGWEVDGADRLIHWQGKPFDIGTPVHPTAQVFHSPDTFVFSGPVAGTYSPWYDPSYWYEGLKPKVKLSSLAPVVLVNITVAANYVIRSPIFLPTCLAILVAGLGLWWTNFWKLWPIVIPTLFGLALYCFVYFEKRYIAGNFVVLWIAMLAGIRFRDARRRALLQTMLVTCALLFTSVFVLLRQKEPIIVAVSDLVHRHESVTNVDYLLAQRFAQLGLHPGDKIAYIGTGINANWARLAQVRIVAEIPLMYGRNHRILNNLLIDDVKQIEAFWNADETNKRKIYHLFRNAGVKMVVTDGYFASLHSARWPRVLPENRPDIPHFYPDIYSQVNTRYHPLDSPLGQ